jgi:hypothetical protein
VRAEVAAAERSREVRDAARAWRRADFIGEQALSAILERYPDDRHRFGVGFRVLAFIFTAIAALALIGLSFVVFEPNLESRGAFYFWGLVLAGLTEWQRGPAKRASAGAETATALLSVLFLVIGSVIDPGASWSHAVVIRFLASSSALCAIAAWRFGDAPFFLGGALSAFGLFAQADHGRLLWVSAAILLVPACLKAARSLRLAPSHRTGAVIVGAISILALYAAIHLWSFDQHVIEDMRALGGSGSQSASPAALRTMSLLATALLPPFLFLAGWRLREPLLLFAGLLLMGASIATIRLYRTVMPLSLALILLGAICLALAFWVRRWLRSGAGGERDGFTADALFDHTNRTDAIRTVVAMASFTPAAQVTPAARSGFEGGGGSFGGGGASGNF